MVEIHISYDRLTAMITLQGDDQVTELDIRNALAEKGVTFGIKDDVISEIQNSVIPVQNVIIAEGIKPQYGRDGKLIWYIEHFDSDRPAITASGQADFKSLKHFEKVKAGQELVSCVPAVEGKPGRDVFGNALSPTGREVQLPTGKNVRISKDGLTLISEIDGFVFEADKRVIIDNVYHIPGNVDFHTGNVKFDGSVVIDGDVRSGFQVEAVESVYIGGNVEAAEIYSHQGDISVHLGIVGQGKAKLLAGRNLNCGFVQNASVGVQKNVTIRRYAINSEILAGGSVFVRENEGLIRGGRIIASKTVIARELGADRKIPTEVTISGENNETTNVRITGIARETRRLQTRLALYQKKVQFFSLLQKSKKELSLDKENEFVQMQEDIANIEKKIDDLAVEEQELMKGLRQEMPSKYIQVTGELHAGVILNIGRQQWICRDSLKNIKAISKGGEIIFEDHVNTVGGEDE